MSRGQDVIDFLVRQHEEIRDLIAEVARTRGDERRHAFTSLRRLLAVHETAEEMVVHPRARHSVDGGDQLVTLRLDEEDQGKRILRALEDVKDVDSEEFEQGFRQLQDAVLTHARNEEEQEFPKLADVLDDTELARMRRAVQLAERTAPTRPHPGVETGGQNLLAGPFAAMLDRARDLLSRD